MLKFILATVLYATCAYARANSRLQVAKCEVSIKDAGVTMPTFYIPAQDIPIFRDVVARAELELRKEAAAALSQVKTEDARKAVKELMDLEFYMNCETANLADYAAVKCQMCNYHEAPTQLHLVQGTVVDSDLESCMTGEFENRMQAGPNFHPTCFPELPSSYNQGGSGVKRAGKKGGDKVRPMLKIGRGEEPELTDRASYEALKFSGDDYADAAIVADLTPRSFASSVGQHIPLEQRLFY